MILFKVSDFLVSCPSFNACVLTTFSILNKWPKFACLLSNELTGKWMLQWNKMYKNYFSFLVLSTLIYNISCVPDESDSHQPCIFHSNDKCRVRSIIIFNWWLNNWGYFISFDPNYQNCSIFLCRKLMLLIVSAPVCPNVALQTTY